MSRERKTDTLTGAMQRIHPTSEPSEVLALKVAQLAEAKASESKWREAVVQRKMERALKLRRVLLSVIVAGFLGVGIAVGPRVFYGVSLWQAAQRLDEAPFLQATSYRVLPDGTQRRVSEFYRRHVGTTIQARLERDELLAIWNDRTLHLSQPGSPFVEQGESSLGDENPVNRVQLAAMESGVFWLSHSARLGRLPDGRLISQHSNRDQRLLIQQATNGAVTALELQVRERGTWKPFLRTTFRTDLPNRPELFDTRFPGKKILNQDWIGSLFENSFLGTKTTLRYAFVNAQGEVYVCLGIPYTGSQEEDPTLELTDEQGRRYVSTGKLVTPNAQWFFPTSSGHPAQKLQLTVRRKGKPELRLTKSVTTSQRRLPQYPWYHDTVRELLDQKNARLLSFLEDAKRQGHWRRVLELTDDGQKLREQHSEIMGRMTSATALYLYRTEALRELGQQEEAREALAHVRRDQMAPQQRAWLEQEEKLLRPK